MQNDLLIFFYISLLHIFGTKYTNGIILTFYEMRGVTLEMGGVLGPRLFDKLDFLQCWALYLSSFISLLANLLHVQCTWM